MKIDQIKRLSPLDRLVAWAKDCQTAAENIRAGKPEPWTDNEIVQQGSVLLISPGDDAAVRRSLNRLQHLRENLPYRGDRFERTLSRVLEIMDKRLPEFDLTIDSLCQLLTGWDHFEQRLSRWNLRKERA